jgi:hypothetical protein
MADIVDLHGGVYKYVLPPQPNREEDILYFDKPKKEQYWRSPVFPDLKRMSMQQRIHYVEDQRQKWAEGAWFFNNGEPTYINGIHWDHLVNMTFKNKKAFYLDNQRKDFLFRELTWKDPKCKGRVFSKCRRYGMSMEEQTEGTYRFVEDFDRFVGLVSIEEKKTKKSLFNPIVDSFVKRPPWMRPVFYKPNNKKPQQILQLTSKGIDDDDDYSFYDAVELNGQLFPSGTTASAFDAYEMDYIVGDEIWKWISCSPKEFLETHLKCLEVGGSIKGLISLLSTLGDSKSQKKAIEEGIEIYRSSNPEARDENGFTKTGLYPYFVSAIYSKFGDDFKDKYGFINEDKAEAVIRNERNNYEEGSNGWVNQVRREPLTEDEAMATAEGTSTFDSIRIENVIKKVKSFVLKKSSDKPFIEKAELIEDTDGRVHFEDTGKGYWTISIKPKKRMLTGEDRSNRWREDYDGFKKITKSPEGAIGYDPVQFAEVQTTSDSISKAAIIAKYKFDYFGNNCANRYAGMWLNRDDDPDLPSYEAYKAAKFWGFPIMHEAQVPGVYKWFKEMKALDFLLKDLKKGTYGLWTDNQKNVIKHGVQRFQSYIKRPKTKEEMDWLETIGLLPLLEDAKKFDPTNTRKFDTFMANIMMEHAMDQIYYSNNLEEGDLDVSKRSAFNTLFGLKTRGKVEIEEEY